MPLKRLAFVVLLAAAAVLLQGSSAPRAIASSDNHFSFSVPLILNSSTCASIPVPISGTATYEGIFNAATNANGSQVLVQNTLATGTVTDALGNVYVFNYHNHVTVQVQPDGSAVVLTNDHFNLVGNGPDAGLHVGFLFVISYASDGTPNGFRIVSVRGDPSCDPI